MLYGFNYAQRKSIQQTRDSGAKKVPGKWAVGWFSAARPNIIMLVFGAANVYARNSANNPSG